MNERSSVHGEDDRTCRLSLYAKSVAPAEAIESFDQAAATLVRIGGAQQKTCAGIARSIRPSFCATVMQRARLSNITIRQRFAGFECRDADRQVAEHSRDRSAIGAAPRVAIVFPEALAISRVIVLIRLAFRDLRIAQRLNLGFPLRLAFSLERPDVARLIRKDDGWVPPDDERGCNSKPSAIPRIPGYVQTHPYPPDPTNRFGKLLVKPQYDRQQPHDFPPSGKPYLSFHPQPSR